MIDVVEDVVIRVRDKTYRLERLPHERCESCGERVFGVDASKRMDAVILKRKRRAA